MSEKFPARPHQSIDENAHSNNEQNASVRKAGECSASGQSSSAQTQATDAQKQKIREIYEQGKAIPKKQQSDPRLEEFRQRLQEKNQQQLKAAVARKPSTGSSSPSIS